MHESCKSSKDVDKRMDVTIKGPMGFSGTYFMPEGGYINTGGKVIEDCGEHLKVQLDVSVNGVYLIIMVPKNNIARVHKELV